MQAGGAPTDEPAVPRWLLGLLAPTVLSVVAVHQLIWANTTSMTPWKGGGFGMFSSTQSPSERFLRVYLQVEGYAQPIPAELPKSLEYLENRLKAQPNLDDQNRMAGELVMRTWVDRRGIIRGAMQRTDLSAADKAKATSSIVEPNRLPRAVALEKGDVQPPEDLLLRVTSVEVSTYNYQYDRLTHQLTTNHYRPSSTAVRTEDAP